MGNSIANMFGGLIAYGVGHITTSSLQSWRLLFLILGAVTSAYAIVLFWFLPDSPEKARFLKEQDRQIAVVRTLANKTGVLDHDKFVMAQVWEALLDPQTWGLCLYTVAVNIANGGLTSVSLFPHRRKKISTNNPLICSSAPLSFRGLGFPTSRHF
jgi:MFS family permease